jgi:hypothetical protein
MYSGRVAAAGRSQVDDRGDDRSNSIAEPSEKRNSHKLQSGRNCNRTKRIAA